MTLKVRLGEHDVSSIAEPADHEERLLTDIVIHPKFDNKTLANDIALVKLATPANRRPNIDIVCIPSEQLQLYTNRSCYVTGWGRNSERKCYE